MTSQGPFPGRPGPVPPRPAPPRPPVRSAYGPRGPGPAPPTDRPHRRSRLAVTGLVLAVLVPPVGLVLGAVARRRITRSASVDAGVRLTGRGAATAAVVVGVLLTLAEAATAVVVLVGVPTSWLPSSDLPAASVQSTIEKTVPLPAGSVRCPGPLPARIGASITCTGAQNGAPVSLRATVSTVDAGGVRFEITRA